MKHRLAATAVACLLVGNAALGETFDSRAEATVSVSSMTVVDRSTGQPVAFEANAGLTDGFSVSIFGSSFPGTFTFAPQDFKFSSSASFARIMWGTSLPNLFATASAGSVLYEDGQTSAESPLVVFVAMPANSRLEVVGQATLFATGKADAFANGLPASNCAEQRSTIRGSGTYGFACSFETLGAAETVSFVLNAGALTLGISPIPEPSAWMQWTLGAALLCGSVRRRTRRARPSA